jgi:DNA-binding transcriptional LysR family regulator
VVFASNAYIERRGRPESPADLARHSVIGYKGALAQTAPTTWLLSHATNVAVVAQSDSVLGALSAVKSGVGLAILPAYIGDPEETLVRVLDMPAELKQPVTMLVHPDLRNTPRVRAFFDFIASEIDQLRPIFAGEKRYR